MSWDPTVYLHYGDERLRPALDLLARVPLEAPTRVVDLGCGPGNVTVFLRRRFPAAAVLGIDGSAAMLTRARAVAPDCLFAEADIATWTADASPDLIYSNATLHWLEGHETLFPQLLGMLVPGGVLAVQMPAMHDAPFRVLQHKVAADGPWAASLAGVVPARAILRPEAYWDLLRPLSATLDVWETTYMHAIEGEHAVAQWATGSSLRPFLDRLEGEMREGYLAAYRKAVGRAYPRRADGTTLLPFRRLFMVATVAA